MAGLNARQDSATIRDTLVDALRLDHIGPDPDEPTHAAYATETLPSAPSTVKEDSFGLTFRHRWAFEFSTERKSDFDGGVVEISLDGGKTWVHNWFMDWVRV